MKKLQNVIINGVRYIPASNDIRFCGTCVKNVQQCVVMEQCIRGGEGEEYLHWISRPSLKEA